MCALETERVERVRLLLRKEQCSSEMLGYSVGEPPLEGERMRTEGRVENRFMALPEWFFQLYVCVYIYKELFLSVSLFLCLIIFVLVFRGVIGVGSQPNT